MILDTCLPGGLSAPLELQVKVQDSPLLRQVRKSPRLVYDMWLVSAVWLLSEPWVLSQSFHFREALSFTQMLGNALHS